MSTRFASRPSRLYLLIAAGVILALLAVGAYFGYESYRDWTDTRSVVTEYINTNVSVYNQTSAPSRELVEELNTLVEFDPDDTADTTQRIASIRGKITEIETLNAEIDSSRESIAPGTIDETEELSSAFRSTLATKKFTLESLSDFLEYQVCLIENATGQAENLDQFTVQITNFSEAEGVSFEDKNQFIQSASTEIKANLQLLNDFDECFEDGYESYLTPELRAVVDADRTLYRSYADSLDSLEQGLTGGDSETVLRATNELVSLAAQEFTLFSSDEINEAIQNPTGDIQAQADVLERAETRLQERLNTLKGDYFLESN